MLEFFKKNISNEFIRICRIQYNSKLRSQTKYAEHYYRLTFTLEGIYYPNTAGNVVEKVVDIYTASGNTYLFTNDNSFYLKTTTTENNSYIDIGYDLTGQYSVDIKCKLDTVDAGSVDFYCDTAVKSEFTKQSFWGTSPIERSILRKGGILTSWLGANTSYKINVLADRPLRVTDMINNVICYMLPDGTLYNSDNTSFTFTRTASDTYKREMTISVKRNMSLLLEVL